MRARGDVVHGQRRVPENFAVEQHFRVARLELDRLLEGARGLFLLAVMGRQLRVFDVRLDHVHADHLLILALPLHRDRRKVGLELTACLLVFAVVEVPKRLLQTHSRYKLEKSF